ncbi:uncharacterized protein LOC110612606 [Manihot esculenta]|uniref:uncharacterized protein LOC110612606 n=1 Tax=Manihot esculenta TaxID=3983 RepID=UPI000B5D1B68|nr:uncharacterized protein LOC110612606 [Manihot esculenta]
MALIWGHASSFAWKPFDMPGIDPEVMTHKLNILPGAKPVKQKKRVFEKEKQQATREEVEKLEEAEFIRKAISDKEHNNALPSLVEEGEGSQLQQEFMLNLFVDGAWNTIGIGAGILLKGPHEFKVCYALHCGFSASNNKAEYEAPLNRMHIALGVGATDLRINSDSQLVVNQVTGVYQVKDTIM